MDISGNFECKFFFFFSNVTLRFSALRFWGSVFNEVSRDQGNRVVMLQNAQRTGRASPLFPRNAGTGGGL